MAMEANQSGNTLALRAVQDITTMYTAPESNAKRKERELYGKVSQIALSMLYVHGDPSVTEPPATTVDAMRYMQQVTAANPEQSD